jgi:hypothetical protein
MLRLVAFLMLTAAVSAQLLYAGFIHHHSTDNINDDNVQNSEGLLDNRRQEPFQPENPERRRRFRPAPPATNIDLVIVGLTPGNRNPEVFLQDDPNSDRWGQEGPGQLNIIGKREGFNLGRALRQRYGNDIINDQFFPTNFMAFSSTGESEQMTCQSLNTGIFPPRDSETKIDPTLNWQPVPLTTDDNLLGISRLVRCPAVRDVMEPIFNGEIPAVRNVLQREQELVNYIVQNTGVRGNVEDLSEVVENLQQMRVRNLPFPDWAERPQIQDLNKERFLRKVQVFRNAVEVACAVHEPCRRLFSGVLLNQIKDIVQTVTNMRESTKQSQTRDRLGMVVYTGDIETILSVFRVLDLDYFNVPSTGGFVLEVRNGRLDSTGLRPVSNPTVRVLYHEPDFNNRGEHNFFLAEKVRDTESRQDCPDNFCPLLDLVRKIHPYTIQDIRVACREVRCNNNDLNLDNVIDEYGIIQKNSDSFVNPKLNSKDVDCNYVIDKYPQNVCQELARNQFCNRNNFVRNVVCRRTCNCNQYATMEEPLMVNNVN